MPSTTPSLDLCGGIKSGITKILSIIDVTNLPNYPNNMHNEDTGGNNEVHQMALQLVLGTGSAGDG